MYPAEQFVAAKAAGVVTCRWESVVSFEFCASTNVVEVLWHADVLERLAMDKSKLAAALAAQIAASAATRRPSRG